MDVVASEGAPIGIALVRPACTERTRLVHLMFGLRVYARRVRQIDRSSRTRLTPARVDRASSNVRHGQTRSSDRPLVSVIVPTYNRASTIRTTIESALAQTYRALEIVVVDDGSTDHTQQVLEEASPHIAIIHQENQGVAAARNTGIRASRGSIVMFLDSDDLWYPHTVDTQVGVLEAAGAETPCAMCDLLMHCSGKSAVSMFVDRKLRPRHATGLWTNVQDVLATRFLFTNQTLAIRREALEATGLFDQSLWVMEDFDLALRLSALGPWAYTTEPLAIRHDDSPDSLSAMARNDPNRLNATILAICRKMQAQEVLASRTARSAIAYMSRKAERALRLGQPASPSTRLFLKAQAFIEEEGVERLFRNSAAYPRLKSSPF